MEHPITPPLEMVEQWADMLSSRSDHAVFSLAAQWGSDQELEACCEWAKQFNYDDEYYEDKLRNARRPKPPSLKKKALGAIGRFTGGAHTTADEMHRDFDTIRRALEALPND